MTVKTFAAQFEGHEILVVNTWFSGIALYIDSEEKDKNDGMFAVKGTEPLLKASMVVNGKEKLIEHRELGSKIFCRLVSQRSVVELVKSRYNNRKSKGLRLDIVSKELQEV